MIFRETELFFEGKTRLRSCESIPRRETHFEAYFKFTNSKIESFKATLLDSVQRIDDDDDEKISLKQSKKKANKFRK